jgi:hypothetical protein
MDDETKLKLGRRPPVCVAMALGLATFLIRERAKCSRS